MHIWVPLTWRKTGYITRSGEVVKHATKALLIHLKSERLPFGYHPSLMIRFTYIRPRKHTVTEGP